MRKVNFIITCIAALMFTACGETATTPKDGAPIGGNELGTEHKEGDGHDHGAEGQAGHDHEAYYTCPDHQDVHEHAAGKCPKCQKDLVKMEEEAHGELEGHDHEAYYTCSMHPEVHEHTAGKCPKCNMDLVKKEGEEH